MLSICHKVGNRGVSFPFSTKLKTRLHMFFSFKRKRKQVVGSRSQDTVLLNGITYCNQINSSIEISPE